MTRRPTRAREVAWVLAGLALCACGPTPPDPVDAGVADAADEPSVDQDALAPDSSDDAGYPDSSLEAGQEDVDAGQSETGSEDSATDAEPVEADLDDATIDQTTDGQGSLLCGDGIRDPASEECDDGLGNTPGDRACDPSCVVLDRLVAASGADSRWLAAGPHAVAAGPSGYAVAFMEMLPADAGGDVRVGVAVFAANGQRAGVAYVPETSLDADPVIAGLPDGSFALALGSSSSSIDGDGLGIALYRIAPDGTIAAQAGAVNTTALFGQHSPDVVWDGQRLMVAWSDDSPSWDFNASGRRHCTRGYSSDLSAIDHQEVCAPESATLPSRQVLAGRNGTVVAAWREESLSGDLSAEYLVVGGTGWTARYGLATAVPMSDSPAVGWLDDDTILAVHSDGTGTLLGVVLASDGAPTWGPEPILAAGTTAFQASLAVTQDGAYVAWAAPSAVDDASLPWEATLDETWIRKLVWTGSGFDPSAEAIPLPRHATHQAGDQTRPMLGAWGALSTEVVASWNDLTLTNYTSSAPHGDVVVELIPTPILRGPGQ